MRRWEISPKLQEWNLRRAITWKLFAKWSWIKDLILSNSSWSQWSRSRRKRGGSWNRKLHKKRVINSQSSFLWSSPTLSSLKRIMRASRRQLRSKKSQSNWTILTGQIGRQFYVSYSPRWIQVIKLQTGEIRHWVQANQEARNNRTRSLTKPGRPSNMLKNIMTKKVLQALKRRKKKAPTIKIEWPD